VAFCVEGAVPKW